MNQQFYIARSLVVYLTIVLFMPCAHANVVLDKDRDVEKYADKVSKSDASDRLSKLNSVIDITITNEVQERIQQYTYDYRL